MYNAVHEYIDFSGGASPLQKVKIYDISKTVFQYLPIAKQLYYIARPVSIGKMHNVFKVIRAV